MSRIIVARVADTTAGGHEITSELIVRALTRAGLMVMNESGCYPDADTVADNLGVPYGDVKVVQVGRV